jgi:hypothetical protein
MVGIERRMRAERDHPMRMTIALVSLLLMVGCAAGEGPRSAPAKAQHHGAFQAQAERGQMLYEEHCAGCHGASGEGTQQAPRLVGLAQGALPLDPRPGQRIRKTEFRTVADVADFVTKYMPLDTPGSLPAQDYWDILAFDLKANGLDLGEIPLDANVAANLHLPR